jgi:hypothetical protein
MTQPHAEVRAKLRPVDAVNADARIASSRVVATHVASVPAATDGWAA